MQAQTQRALSPVIGVALLITITALLAASLLAIVPAASISTAGPWDGTPDAQFEITQSGSWVTIEHVGGEEVASDALRLEGVPDDFDGTVREGDELLTTPDGDRVAVVYDGPAGEETLAERRLST